MISSIEIKNMTDRMQVMMLKLKFKAQSGVLNSLRSKGIIDKKDHDECLLGYKVKLADEILEVFES